MNTMLSSEVWQDIQGYSGIYQVSTLGRIRSLKKGKIKLLKPYINNMGYAVLSLYANHKQKTYHVHKLVGIKQPEIIFGNLINKLNYESKSKRW